MSEAWSGRFALTFRPDLIGRTWARFEVGDVAANGAFTQPVRIEAKRAVAEVR